MHSFGSLGALTGLIIARLKESKGDLQLSKDEETWFGEYIAVIDLINDICFLKYFFQNMPYLKNV